MAVGHVLLIVLKNFLYHLVCLGSAPRYFALKASVMRAAARLGAYEGAYFRLLPLFIRPGSEVIDVGANFGAYTLVMAKLVGPRGKVFAFEPLPTAADVLTRRCEGLDNVVVVPEALSDGRTEVVDLRVPFLAVAVPEPALAAVDPAPWAGSGLKTWKVFRVAVRRLDDHLAAFHDISLIKVDIEGHEAAFLRGAVETIRRFRPVLQLESSGVHADQATVDDWRRGARYVLLGFRAGKLEVVTGGASQGLNVYCVPEELVARLPPEVLHRPDQLR